MRKVVSFVVVLSVLLSLPAFAFISDFEGVADTVEIHHRWSDVDFWFVDGWFARIDISDTDPAEVINATSTVYEGGHALGVILYDTASADPGADRWDFNSRPGEGGRNHFTDVDFADTIGFQVWIPPEGEGDSSLVFRPYAQYLDWGVWDANDSVSIDSLRKNLGFAGGGWKLFTVILPDTVSGDSVLAVGIQFNFPEVVNSGDTIFVDYINRAVFIFIL